MNFGDRTQFKRDQGHYCTLCMQLKARPMEVPQDMSTDRTPVRFACWLSLSFPPSFNFSLSLSLSQTHTHTRKHTSKEETGQSCHCSLLGRCQTSQPAFQILLERYHQDTAGKIKKLQSNCQNTQLTLLALVASLEMLNSPAFLTEWEGRQASLVFPPERKA